MKKALLVGINKHEDPKNDLRGCVNDTKNLYQLLTHNFNFHPDNMRVLLNERATFDEIYNRLKWLVKDCKPGDTLFWSFSGHGSQIRDRSGDELKDGLDEILIPFNHSWDKPFLDDYIGEIFKNVPKGVNLTVIVDSCHSGTMTRQIEQEDRIPRRIIPPFDIEARSLGRDDLIVSHFGMRDFYEQNHILLSGCQDDETSADAFLEGDFHGALTFNFCKVVRDYISKNKPLILSDIHRDVISNLKKDRFTQNPKLTGPNKLLKEVPFLHHL
jgi:metacaspase-1